MSVYVAAARAGVRRAFGTPGELAVRAGFYAVLVVVFDALWGAAARSAGGVLRGYDHAALVWYVIAAEGAVTATKPRLIEEIGDDIGSSMVAVEMLRPVRVVAFRMAAELGEACARLSVLALVGLAMGYAFVGAPPAPGAALLALPAALLALGCNIALQHAFAAGAFWLEDAKATWFLYQKLVFLLGGMLIPLELLPGWLESWARALPFWSTAYAPARLAAGHFEPWLLAGQAAWLCAALGAAVAAFGLGERRLQAAGG